MTIMLKEPYNMPVAVALTILVCKRLPRNEPTLLQDLSDFALNRFNIALNIITIDKFKNVYGPVLCSLPLHINGINGDQVQED